MAINTIRDIYAGMPDAKDEINTAQGDKFFASFIAVSYTHLDVYKRQYFYRRAAQTGCGLPWE